MLSIEKLNQFYGQSHTLWDVSLSVKPNTCTTLIGRNGMGKTSLLKSVMGAVNIKSGDITFNKQAIQTLPSHKRVKLGLGYVPQGREIFPKLTVLENLKIALFASTKTTQQIPPFIFELFPVLDEMKNRLGGNLSGGQQQQLAIGRALCVDPKLLILDEPTEGIQPNIVEQIGHAIEFLIREKQMSILLIEQKIKFAKQFANYFYVINNGRIVHDDAIDGLDESVIERFLSV